MKNWQRDFTSGMKMRTISEWVKVAGLLLNLKLQPFWSNCEKCEKCASGNTNDRVTRSDTMQSQWRRRGNLKDAASETVREWQSDDSKIEFSKKVKTLSVLFYRTSFMELSYPLHCYKLSKVNCLIYQHRHLLPTLVKFVYNMLFMSSIACRHLIWGSHDWT